MVLLQRACVFFWRSLESRNYKIQIVAHVEGRSVALLSGTMEASYSHFFIGRGFESQRALLENVKLGKLVLIGLQSPREYDGRLPLDVGYYLNLVIPRFEESQKKNTCML